MTKDFSIYKPGFKVREEVGPVFQLNMQTDASGYTTFKVSKLQRGRFVEILSGADRDIDAILRSFGTQVKAAGVMKQQLTCAMRACSNSVTHIGEKGWVYCSPCAKDRQYWERCRKLRIWEITRLQSDKPISYKPMAQHDLVALLDRRENDHGE